MADEKNLPWMKFYPSDFMGSQKVRSMKGIERGIYISLMCKCWETEDGAIRDDPDELWMECGVTPEQMRDAWPKVRKCFEAHSDREGYIIQPRVEEEREKAVSRREAARKAGQARAGAAGRDDTGQFSGEASDQPAKEPAGAGADAGHDAGGDAGEHAGSPLARSDASDAQSSSESTDVQKSTEGSSLRSSPSGEDAAVENSRETENKWGPTVTACQEHVWLDDDPPRGRSRGQELSVAKQLEGRWNADPDEIALACEGFGRLRDQGFFEGWIEPGEPACLLAVNRTPEDENGIPVYVRCLHEMRKNGAERVTA